MKTFRVAVQPTDYGFSLFVEGIENTHWLLDRLGRSFVFRSAEPIVEANGSPYCTCQISGGSQLSPLRLGKLLAAIPEVTLVRVAAAK